MSISKERSQFHYHDRHLSLTANASSRLSFLQRLHPISALYLTKILSNFFLCLLFVLLPPIYIWPRQENVQANTYSPVSQTHLLEAVFAFFLLGYSRVVSFETQVLLSRRVCLYIDSKVVALFKLMICKYALDTLFQMHFAFSVDTFLLGLLL